MGTYQEIEHTADYALLVRGSDLRDLLQAALDGFVALVIDEDRPAPVQWREYKVQADDPATLVMRSVRELLHRLEDGEVPVAAKALEASEEPALARVSVGLAPLAVARKHLHRAIKAVTYHDLQIRRDEHGLSLVLTFDT
jgi:SHS2 domain-containing protein